jgi:hypothetical protein
MSLQSPLQERDVFVEPSCESAEGDERGPVGRERRVVREGDRPEHLLFWTLENGPHTEGPAGARWHHPWNLGGRCFGFSCRFLIAPVTP